MKKSKGTGNASFPYQKRPTSEKNRSFMIECTDAAIKMTVGNTGSGIRSDRYNKQINYDLANGILHEEDMYKITNPFNIEGFDRELQDYPLIKPRLNLLIGEEINRRFDYAVRVQNADAISSKEDEMKSVLMEILQQEILSMHYDEKEMQVKLQQLDKWRKYSYEDIRERMATQVIGYLWKDLKLEEVFNMCMEDVVIAAEEVVHIDIVNGNVVIRRVNPLNLYTVRESEDSIYIDDSDIIVENGYQNTGTVIDTYYEYLKASDIEKIENGVSKGTSTGPGKLLNYTVNNNDVPVSDVLIDTDDTFNGMYAESAPFSGDGMVNVCKVTWRSLRKIGILSFVDETGKTIKRFVDERYKPNKMLGEKVKWVWIPEWWSATKIAYDIYVDMGPKKVQPLETALNRISGSGYVGTVYSVGTTKARSLMDILRPYQYLYDEFMDRIKQAFAKFKGPMIELDFAKMPEGWEPEKWMHYAENMGYLIVDSFKEGSKGSATGKLAGSFNTTNRVINPDLGNYIQQHIMMLEYIEKQIGIISGINDQRLGEIKSTETVGGVERAVTQSSHITERLFKLHDNTKLRVLETLLEYAKLAWRDDNKKLQFVLDDMTSKIIEIDGGTLSEADYGIFISDSRSDMELKQSLKKLGGMLVQSGKASISTLIDIYNSDSMASMRAKIETAEEDANRREQEVQQQQLKSEQQQQQIEQQQAQAELALEKAKIALEERIAIMDNQTKIAIESMKDDGSDTEIKKMELDLKQRELELSAMANEQKANLENKHQTEKLNLEQQKIDEQKRSNKAKESIGMKQKSNK